MLKTTPLGCKNYLAVRGCSLLDNKFGRMEKSETVQIQFNCYGSLTDTIHMKNHIIKNCKKCNGLLRIPADIGGMLMQCPNCGHEFHTDFKLVSKAMNGGDGKEQDREMPATRPLSTFNIVV